MKTLAFSPALFTLLIWIFAGSRIADAEPALPPATEPTPIPTPAAEVRFGAFIDAYYAFDLNQPRELDRAYTTQPARHNEFNLNLVYLEAKLQRERVHGRLALQAGTSVQSNYAGEPDGTTSPARNGGRGAISGGLLSRHVQEAYAGYRLGTDTWLDAGVFFSHIGLESFISKDNLTYTRSLVADYSPYYETGLRLSTRLAPCLTGQLLILNGWQNISESNPAKSLGTQLKFELSPAFTLTYNTYLGQEAAFRQFHDLVLQFQPSDQWSLAAQADIGDQQGMWNGFTLIAKRQFDSSLAAVARIERYEDPHAILITTPGGQAFRSWGGSLGLDVALDSNVWWRSEVRGWLADAPVFNSANGLRSTDGVGVMSLSAAF